VKDDGGRQVVTRAQLDLAIAQEKYLLSAARRFREEQETVQKGNRERFELARDILVFSSRFALGAIISIWALAALLAHPEALPGTVLSGGALAWIRSLKR